MQIGYARRNRFFTRILVLGAGALIAASLASRSGAATYQETVLYSFCLYTEGAQPCPDGASPLGGLFRATSGNLYGMTGLGGGGRVGPVFESGEGTVFELKPNAAKTAWTQQVLYSFCAQPDCTDGAEPVAGLIRDAAGNFYGTTLFGGAYSKYDVVGGGTVFKLTPDAGTWKERVLYRFCLELCSDGSAPSSGVIMDASGNLYGTTSVGGPHVSEVNAVGGGTVFELTPNPADPSAAWTLNVLYSFCAQGGGKLCTDGERPDSDLITDAAGNLYGTTSEGGAYSSGTNDPEGAGTVFELTPNASRTAWTQQVLYSFCAQGGELCTDGEWPNGGLVMDASGNLYGTTSSGGAGGAGTVFELTPNASRTAWTQEVLRSFCTYGGKELCTDGAFPAGGLVMDASGKLYGTTYDGGAYGSSQSGGTVFELIPTATIPWRHEVLYSFCAQGGELCTDGGGPGAGLIRAASGELYGTTEYGGAYGAGSTGTVFELKP